MTFVEKLKQTLLLSLKSRIKTNNAFAVKINHKHTLININTKHKKLIFEDTIYDEHTIPTYTNTEKRQHIKFIEKQTNKAAKTVNQSMLEKEELPICKEQTYSYLPLNVY